MPNCLNCDTQISNKSKNGRCRPCANRARAWSPDDRAKASMRWRDFWRERLADPAHLLTAVEAGKRLRAQYPYEENIKDQPTATALSAEKRRAWCPPEYRAFDDTLRAKSYKLDRRQRLVAEKIAADRRATAANLTGLELQLWKLRNGAKLVERFDARQAYDYSLTGSSAALL